MTSSALDHLLAVCPSWFVATQSGRTYIEGCAHVPVTPWTRDGVALRLEGVTEVRVREQVPGTCFPAYCPERHIQGDNTFCIGLRRPSILSQADAHGWWDQLRQYLICQAVAEQTGVWPPVHALDHGEAGKHHERALQIAEQLGICEEYAAARLNEPSWITDRHLRLLDKQGKPINGRAACPRGCKARSRTTRPILRRDCDKRLLLLELVQCERMRRAALAQYWDDIRRADSVCCGRMRSCELRSSSPTPQSGTTQNQLETAL